MFRCKSGQWGDVECTRIEVEMPEAFVSLDQIKSIHAHWFFKFPAREQTVAFLQSAGVSRDELARLANESKWEQTPAGWWVSPKDDLVLALNSQARAKLYSYLSDFPENEAQYSAMVFRPEILPARFKNSGLSESTITRFNQLVYRESKMLVFADTDVFVNSLPDEHEKIRFLKTISRTPTLLVKLKIDSTSNIDQLVDYWGYGRRRKDVRSLLESMAAVPGGCKIDVAHLLPSFARQHIYTFPDPVSDTVTNQHCHWTSLNFMKDIPDDRFSDENFARQTIQSEFLPISDPPRLGDVIFFLDENGMVVHSATFIADNIVFTKNGGAPNRPWIFMELEDLTACYVRPHEPLKTVIFRRKQV